MKGQAAAGGGGGERASKRVAAGGDAEAAQRRRSGRIANDGSITTVPSMFVIYSGSILESAF